MDVLGILRSESLAGEVGEDIGLVQLVLLHQSSELCEGIISGLLLEDWLGCNRSSRSDFVRLVVRIFLCLGRDQECLEKGVLVSDCHSLVSGLVAAVHSLSDHLTGNAAAIGGYELVGHRDLDEPEDRAVLVGALLGDRSASLREGDDSMLGKEAVKLVVDGVDASELESLALVLAVLADGGDVAHDVAHGAVDGGDCGGGHGMCVLGCLITC